MRKREKLFESFLNYISVYLHDVGLIKYSFSCAIVTNYRRSDIGSVSLLPAHHRIISKYLPFSISILCIGMRTF